MADEGPVTYAQLKIQYDAVEAQIQLVITGGPAKFYEITGGTVRISMKDWMDMLMKRRDELYIQLSNTPYFVGSYVEGAL